jgi:hypothetical protein
VARYDEENFHLVLLNQLLRHGRVTEAELEAFVRAGVDVEALRRGAEEDGIPGEAAAARAVVARLAARALDDDDYAAIESLTSDGGDDIYMLIEGLVDIDSGGEEDWYDTVGSQELRACRNVRRVVANCYFQGLDCELLVGLPAVEKVDLGLRWRHAEALLRVPALQQVTVRGELPAPLVAELAARGVQVDRRR